MRFQVGKRQATGREDEIGIDRRQLLFRLARKMPEEVRVSLRMVFLPEKVFMSQIPPDIDRMHLVFQGANQVQSEARFAQALCHRPAVPDQERTSVASYCDR